MKDKKWWWIVGAIVIIAAVLIGLRFMRSSALLQQQTIKIGAILPLTGDLSTYGADTQKALDLAVEQANQSGGISGKKIALIVEDSHGAATQAVAAFNKLVDINKVDGVLGPITSAEVLSAAPIANTKRVPLISPSATSTEITNAGEYIFRTINADTVETEAFAKFVKENLKLSSVGIIALQAAGTMSYANSFEKFYTNLGGAVGTKEFVSEGTSNYRAPIKKLLAANPQAIYISGYSTEIGQILKQIRESNQDIPLLSYQSAEDKRVVEIAGSAVNGLIFSSTTLPEDVLGKAREEFVRNFKDKFKKEPGVFAPEIYDGINVLVAALKQSSGDGPKMIDALKKTSNYVGASGEITFDNNGDVHKPIAIYKYERGTPKLLHVVE